LIVDTNALSAFADGVVSVRAALRDSEGPCLPVIVLGEYRFGLLDSRERTRRERWLEELLRYWTVLPVTAATAEHYAQIRRSLKKDAAPIPSNDTWIAALALEHGLPLLTNDAHFNYVRGVNVVTF
jgi:tRNA(fMet)-specific endonuclease VapC